jgi:hypothetical protein
MWNHERLLYALRKEDPEILQRQRFDTSKLSWESDELASPVQLSPALKKTQELLRLFAKNLRAVKISLFTAARRPEFPDSEWNNIIQGRPVDLDNVINGVVFVGPSMIPIRKIQNSCHWLLAWGRAHDAIAFVFPHRSRELEGYRTHILRMFGAIDSSFHGRVILYDQLIRARVSRRGDLVLTYFDEFYDLLTIYIWSIGMGGTATSCESESSVSRNHRPRKFQSNVGAMKMASTHSYQNMLEIDLYAPLGTI